MDTTQKTKITVCTVVDATGIRPKQNLIFSQAEALLPEWKLKMVAWVLTLVESTRK